MDCPPMIDKNKQYRTRDGREVRIYATDGGGEHPVHGSVFYPEEKEWGPEKWTAQGFWMGDINRRLDLIEVKPRIQREVWVNVYTTDLTFHKAKKDADYIDEKKNRLACVCLTIDCEEGEGL